MPRINRNDHSPEKLAQISCHIYWDASKLKSLLDLLSVTKLWLQHAYLSQLTQGVV